MPTRPVEIRRAGSICPPSHCHQRRCIVIVFVPPLEPVPLCPLYSQIIFYFYRLALTYFLLVLPPVLNKLNKHIPTCMHYSLTRWEKLLT